MIFIHSLDIDYSSVTKSEEVFINKNAGARIDFIENTTEKYFLQTKTNYNIADNLYSGKIYKCLPYYKEWIKDRLPLEINKYSSTNRGKAIYYRLKNISRFDIVNSPLFSGLDFNDYKFEFKNPEFQQNFTNEYINDQLLVIMLRQYYKKEKLLISIMKKKMFNLILFVNGFMHNLNQFVSNIYNKNVIIKIINLKYIYLNSHLLTRAILIRLRNLRKSSLYSILGQTTNLIKIKKRNPNSFNLNSPILKYVKEHHNSFDTLNLELFNASASNNDQYMSLNKTSNINSIFFNKYLDKNIDKDLPPLSLTDNSNKIKSNAISNSLHNNKFNLYSDNIFSNVRSLNNIQNNTINFIKYKSIFGIKLHASGRLTKRYTASRAVSKYRNKGSLRNNYLITRSKKTMIIKNNDIGNLQFTKLNSKIRTGAFGIKGWVNSN